MTSEVTGVPQLLVPWIVSNFALYSYDCQSFRITMRKRLKKTTLGLSEIKLSGNLSMELLSGTSKGLPNVHALAQILFMLLKLVLEKAKTAKIL